MKVPSYRFEVFSQTYFSVRYSDYPNSEPTNQDNLKYIYDYQRDRFLELTNAKLISERDIWLDDKLGREIVVNTETFLNLNNQIAIYRFYKIGNRTFQLNTSFNESLNEDIEAQMNAGKFLDSFQIIEK